jgi:hypothetical protein
MRRERGGGVKIEIFLGKNKDALKMRMVYILEKN